MYPVSEKYIEAIRAPVREDRITGGIRLKDGTIIPVDDSIIVQKSLTVTRKVSSSSKFDIGTVNSAEMRIKIRDAKAYDHDFGGAVISLKYGIVTAAADDGSETWEDVPLPPFYVDGGEAARKQNMVSLIAHDTLSRLAVDKGSPPTTSLYAALTYFCNRCNVGVAISESDFNALPNADITPDFSAESIQSCWDGVMWIAQTVNCCAFADYRGLVQLKQYKYEGGDNYDRLITGKERTTIEYSDTRTYLAYLQSYEGENVKLYSRVKTWTGTDAPHIKEGALNLPKNPVVQSLSAEQQAAINQSYLNNRSYPTRYVKASGVPDPAIEPLDVLAFSGGTIDIGQIISVATQVTWKYRNGGTIYCANVDEYSDTADGTSAIAALSLEGDAAEQSDEAPVMRTQPKSQTEKRIDELRKQLSQAGGTAGVLTEYQYLTDTSVKFNGMTYTVEKDADTGLISKISDSAGNEFEPEISAGITDVAMHNAVFWAVAMCRGISKTAFIMDGIFGMFTPDTRDIANSRWRNSVSGYNDITLSGGSENGSALHYNPGEYGSLICDEPNTVYAILRADYKSAGGMTWFPLITKHLSIDSKYYGFDIFSLFGQESDYNTIAFSAVVRDIPSSVDSSGFHIVCYTRDSGKILLYIDSVLVGAQNRIYTGNYGGNMLLNFSNRGGRIPENHKLTSTDIVLCAFGSQYHDAATVQKNTAYLMKKYNVGGNT